MNPPTLVNPALHYTPCCYPLLAPYPHCFSSLYLVALTTLILPLPPFTSPPLRARIVDSNVQRVVLKRTDMADYKQRFAVVICMQAMEHFYYYKDIAGYVKRQFDARFVPASFDINSLHPSKPLQHQRRPSNVN